MKSLRCVSVECQKLILFFILRFVIHFPRGGINGSWWGEESISREREQTFSAHPTLARNSLWHVGYPRIMISNYYIVGFERQLDIRRIAVESFRYAKKKNNHKHKPIFPMSDIIWGVVCFHSCGLQVSRRVRKARCTLYCSWYLCMSPASPGGEICRLTSFQLLRSSPLTEEWAGFGKLIVRMDDSPLDR